jgi:hypothetical protein
VSSFSILAKKDSAVALSSAEPRSPIERRMPVSRAQTPKATEVYWARPGLSGGRGPGRGGAARGHLERRADQLGFHRRGHRPADDRAREAVEHRRQVERALIRSDAADVGEPELVRPRGAKAAADQIRRRAHAPQADGRSPAPLAPAGASQARLAHQALDPLAGDADALAAQLGVDARRAVGAAALGRRIAPTRRRSSRARGGQRRRSQA